MTKYVLGFMFSERADNVVLIQKNRPAWQRGLLNGIGGKAEEEDKTYVDAMVREYEEEAGVVTRPNYWLQFARLLGSSDHKEIDYSINCFACVNEDYFYRSKTVTDETIKKIPVLNLPGYSTTPQLRWMIPMAASLYRGEHCDMFLIHELYSRDI